MFQQGINNRRNKQCVVDFLRHELRDEGGPIKRMMQDHLPPADEPRNVHGANGGHVHQRPGGNQIVPPVDGRHLEAEGSLENPVIVGKRAAFGFRLGSR